MQVPITMAIEQHVSVSNFLLFALYLCASHLYCTSCTEHWVCPNKYYNRPCITLSELHQNAAQYLTSNTVIHFLSGVHTSNASGIISPLFAGYSGVRNITLNGEVSSHKQVVIECFPSKLLAFGFMYSENVYISNLYIKNCGVNVKNFNSKFMTLFNKGLSLSERFFQTRRLDTLREVNSTLVALHVTELHLNKVTVTNGNGFGFFSIETWGLHMKNCNFQNNKAISSFGGNALVIIFNPTPSNAQGFLLHFKFSNFSGGYNPSPFSEFDFRTLSGGLGIKVHNSKPNSSRIKVLLEQCTFSNNRAHYGANMHISMTTKRCSVSVTDCTFQNGTAAGNGGSIYFDFFNTFSQLQLKPILHVINGTYYFKPSENPQLGTDHELTIDNSTFVSNRASENGGAISFPALRVWISILISECRFYSNSAKNGGAISLVSDLSERRRTNFTMLVKLCHFLGNEAMLRGGSLHIYQSDGNYNDPVKLHFSIDRCEFRLNEALMGSTVSVVDKRLPSLNVSVSGSEFISNCYTTNQRRIHSVINLEYIEHFLISETSIENNNCSAIHANMSIVSIESHVIISHNTAMNGAGILLECNCLSDFSRSPQIILNSGQAHLTIHDNIAREYGGGILYTDGCSPIELCFFRTKYGIKVGNPHVSMGGNTAGQAGGSVYGGNLETCIMDRDNSNSTVKEQFFWSTFSIKEQNTSSALASQPYKVCICTLEFSTNHQCKFQHTLSTYPGQLFLIPIVGVGQYNYSSASVIRAELLNEGQPQAHLGETMKTQDARLDCKNLTYQIFTDHQNYSLEMKLSIERHVFQIAGSVDSEIAIQILPCPHGFGMDRDTMKCVCADILRKAGVTCNIENRTIQRTPFMWIGNYSGEVVIHNNCPYDYCNRSVLTIDPYNQQQQCDFNRSGVLCGTCRPGLSLVLGTSQCRQCSNVYLLLIIPFALAGVVLVALLLKCNLTVSTGSINGLIFYANVLQANRPFYFPPNKGLLSNFLSVFIAWLNLDFGIETCFADDLDAYKKTWLQFVFPIYIWLMVGTLIIVSRYSTTISRLTGSNTVSVLATLFILSYAKLLRAALSSFSPLIVMGSNETSTMVWLPDGSYNYLRLPHILLFLFAIVITLVYLIPFTLVLLFSPLLQKYSSSKLLFWVTKFKPLIDAYEGPYNTNVRFWTGLMLMTRFILFVGFAGNVVGDPGVNLTVIVTVIMLLLCLWWRIGSVYRHKLKNYLEIFILLNLAILSALTLQQHMTCDNYTWTEVFVCISAGIAFIAFLSILMYHCWGITSSTRLGKTVNKTVMVMLSNTRIREQIRQVEQESDRNALSLHPTLPTFTVVDTRLEQSDIED